MDTLLWIATGIVALLSAAAGVNKLVRPREKLLANPQMSWAEDFTQGQIRLIAAAELAGAIGIVVPWALDVAPVLTPIAAVGLALLQGGALRTHLMRHETQVMVFNAVLIALAVFVAIGRFADL
jgi:DoxX-like family